jgi:hypothetical protein
MISVLLINVIEVTEEVWGSELIIYISLSIIHYASGRATRSAAEELESKGKKFDRRWRAFGEAADGVEILHQLSSIWVASRQPEKAKGE